MIHRSPRSTAEALVRTGRALRRVSDAENTSHSSHTGHSVHTGTRGLLLRAVPVLLLAALAVLGVAPAASAANSLDPEIVAVMDRAPDLPGVSLTVETTAAGSQFVLDNPTPTEVTVLSAAGDPLFRIGPGGVLANFRSPDWYSSKSAETQAVVPPRAADRGKPVWVRVSPDPAWGWFDQRLRDASLDPDQKSSMSPLDSFGSWSVPMLFGDKPGAAEGHFEYRPPMGTFVPSLSETQPAPGVQLTALPGNPTPGVSVDAQNVGEVVVLGGAGEPFLRITPAGSEANELSPTWLSQQDGTGPQKGDPAAPPQWKPIGTSRQLSFTVPWADTDLPPADLYALSSSTDVKNWTVSLVVDGQRVDVPGVTTFNPADRGGLSVWWWIGGSVVLLAVVLVGVRWWLRRNRSGTGKGSGPEKTGAHRTPVSAGR